MNKVAQTQVSPARRRRHLVSRLGSLGNAAVRSVGGVAATVLVAAFVIFVALDRTPGSPVDRIAGPRATDEKREQVRQSLGLDDPLLVRFGHWVTDALQGDFGTSYVYRQDVSELVAPRLGISLSLVALAALITIVVGVAVGAFGGKSRRWRPVVSVVAGLGLSIPSYVSASVLIGVAAVTLGWFPTYGAGDGGIVDRLHHLALPAIALSLGWSAYVMQMTSAGVREQADRDHVHMAIGRGLSARRVFWRHVLRNSVPPVLTASGLTVAGLVAGSLVVEAAFGIDGIGSFLVRSVVDKDVPVVLAISVFIVMVFVVVMAVVDLLLAGFDPRTRQK